MDRHTQPRNPIHLFLGLSCIIVLSAIINIFPPDTIYALTGFFLLIITSAVLLGLYIFRHRRHALLLSLGIAMFFVLRLIGLRHGLFTVLLIVSIFALEYLWRDNTR